MTNSKIFWPVYIAVVLALVTLFAFLYKNFIFEDRDPLQVVYTSPPQAEERHAAVEDRVERQIPDLSVDPKTIAAGTDPKGNNFVYRVYNSANNVISDYARSVPVSFGAPYSYSDMEGITCFRGNNFNNTASYGLAKVFSKELEVAWEYSIGYIDEWTGVGWNGQPLIVKWGADDIAGQNFRQEYKSRESLVEVIYGTMDGHVYFLDSDTGRPTREGTINIGAPIKGTVTLDPRGLPILYVGQGVNTNGGEYVPFKYRIFSLVDFELMYSINMEESAASRSWGATDSTLKVDKNTDTAFLCGENGLVYSIKLNSSFDKEAYKISISPEVVKYYYQPLAGGSYGIESTPAFFKNYMFLQDNNGTLQCLDVNSLKPLWVRDVTDDSDGAIVLEVESGDKLSLYTACEVDKQTASVNTYLRKINAMTGELLWQRSVACSLDKDVTGGTLACPLVGKARIDDLVYFSVARTDGSYRGRLYALNKATGDIVWTKDMPYYCWSTPTAFYTSEGDGYIIQCDSMGYMYLFDGRTGETLFKLNLKANIEGSPAIYGNTIVIGTRGQRIYGVVIR